jgi:uncharacterized protein
MLDNTLFAPQDTLAAQIISAMPDLAGDMNGDGAHDASHLSRVWQNVRRIAQTEGGDLRILAAATLLHDCVHLPKSSPLRASASKLAADQARHILHTLDWTTGDIDRTAHAIAAHSFSANLPTQSLEARILQDADRLDALGHIGIARCFHVSGGLNRALYDPADPKAEHRPLDDTKYALDHFQTKLLKLSQGFQTATGQTLAQARHTTVQQFVDGIIAEVAGR